MYDPADPVTGGATGDTVVVFPVFPAVVTEAPGAFAGAWDAAVFDDEGTVLMPVAGADVPGMLLVADDPVLTETAIAGEPVLTDGPVLAEAGAVDEPGLAEADAANVLDDGPVVDVAGAAAVLDDAGAADAAANPDVAGAADDAAADDDPDDPVFTVADEAVAVEAD